MRPPTRTALTFTLPWLRRASVMGWALGMLMLSGCGGGGVLGVAQADPEAAAAAAEAEGVDVQPSFHRLPMAVAEPNSSDADGAGLSAFAPPLPVTVPPELAALDTSNLTDDSIAGYRATNARALAETTRLDAAPAITPVVYTPAQIRTAYRLPVLPAVTARLAVADAAALGAGQTIYIVDAYHHPNALADLSLFSSKFGLPACTPFSVPIGSTTLAPATDASGCTVAVVHSGSNGSVVAKVPAYNAAWATEIALDLQWAHAIAPLARLVLIEGANNGKGLLDAIALANKLGNGVVSMSFSGAESRSINSTSGYFQRPGMSYLASTGDRGAAANWPAVMSNVIAVGGTSLQSSGNGTRSETAWSRTGGGISTVVAMPAYQGALDIPGQGATRYRSVADVSFNADPNTGQYFVFTAPGAKTASWYVGGGTSIAAPQWAGIVAVANAQRALKGLPPLGAFHAKLYANFSPASSAYLQSFFDVTSGSNGTCAACAAAAGYDSPTGLGTPKADNLLRVLSAQ